MMIPISASGDSPVRTADGRPAVLTVEEAAAELRLGRTTTYDLVKRGVIPSLRLGRQIRVPRFAVERMLAEAAENGERKEAA